MKKKPIDYITLSCLAGMMVAGATAAQKPNIVYILADDMGIGDVSSQNPAGKIITPHIDSLAKQGMSFIDAHTNSSVCTPTRYGILTGRYCWRTTKKSNVLGGFSAHLIDPERETVGKLLQKNGYATACVGKWHLGMDWPLKQGVEKLDRLGKNVDFQGDIVNGPNDVGFDYYYGISASFNMAPHAYIENRKVDGEMELYTDKAKFKERFYDANIGWVGKNFEQEELLTTLANKASEWILQQKKDKPFFLYMPLPSPHSPITPRDEFKNKSGLNDYADFCLETDWVVGEISAALKKGGFEENTIMIFTADNGCSPKGGFSKLQAAGHFPSAQYKGLKGCLFEGGHRVPFIVSWPAAVKANSLSDQLICTTDLFATAADIIGASYSDNTAEDSVSFYPSLQGADADDKARGAVIHHSDCGKFSIRSGKWKMIYDADGGSRRKNPKDAPVSPASDVQLYDMHADAEESVNLFAQHPEVVKAVHAEFIQLVESGRSTPGAAQQNEGGNSWAQYDEAKALVK